MKKPLEIVRRKGRKLVEEQSVSDPDAKFPTYGGNDPTVTDLGEELSANEIAAALGARVVMMAVVVHEDSAILVIDGAWQRAMRDR